MRWLILAILALLGILAAQRWIYLAASFAGRLCASSEEFVRVKTAAQRDCELFLFVNDAVLMWPGKTEFFYLNNRGVGKLTVERLE